MQLPRPSQMTLPAWAVRDKSLSLWKLGAAGAHQPARVGKAPQPVAGRTPEFPRGTGMAVFAAPIRPHGHHNVCYVNRCPVG